MPDVLGFLHLSEEAQFSQCWLLLGFFWTARLTALLTTSTSRSVREWGPGWRQISDTNLDVCTWRPRTALVSVHISSLQCTYFREECKNISMNIFMNIRVTFSHTKPLRLNVNLSIHEWFWQNYSNELEQNSITYEIKMSQSLYLTMQ